MQCMKRIKGVLQYGSTTTRISFSGCVPTFQQQQQGATLPIDKKKNTYPQPPKFRYPLSHLKQERAKYNEGLTAENRMFIKEVVEEKYGPPAILSGISTYQLSTPLKKETIAKGEWNRKTRRTGLITRKIGCYPMWKKTGDPIFTTLLQVIDNHVVDYIPPEVYNEHLRLPRYKRENLYGCLLIGAESMDPQNYTKPYSKLFEKAGLMPKRVLSKFMVSPEAAIQPGTPLYASHFRPGEVVDVRGLTVYRGFQGVMKRWGFKGLPATHGVTKSHRRGGNIGGGSKKAGVWKGTKMPGFMGGYTRIHRGLKIWRINTKYNVLWVQGLGVPGEVNSLIYIHDTLLPLRKLREKPPGFPTHYPEDDDEPFPENLYDDDVHHFEDPSILYEEEK